MCIFVANKMFILLLFFVPFVSSQSPQICNKLFVSRVYDYYSIGNLTVSANLELFPSFNATTIFVSNVTVEGDVHLGIPNSVCVNIDYTQETPTPEFCSSSLNASFNFTTQKPDLNLQIHFTNQYFLFYFGFIDNGTFNYEDGSLFSSQNSSFTEIDEQEFYYTIFTQTCTSFVPAPTPPSSTANAPKCKTFKSQILILNTTNNYNIYGSSYMTWNLGYRLEANGNSTIPGGYFFDYIINNDEEEESCSGVGCSFYLKPGDKKLIISAATEKRIGFNVFTFPIPMLGRIILRGNQTLMAEGIPFSTKDDCLYFNFPYFFDLISTNKFCCIDYEDT